MHGVVYSTDDYFLRNGTYKYDFSLLSHAHAWNQDRTAQAMIEGTSPVIIDNTNMQLWEMKPYIVFALKHKYEVRIPDVGTLKQIDFKIILKFSIWWNKDSESLLPNFPLC